MFWIIDYYLNYLFTHDNDESERNKIKFKKDDVLYNRFYLFDKNSLKMVDGQTVYPNAPFSIQCNYMYNKTPP